ncbi:hypothetical protein GC163_05535 [bacterium]|nr:hypothetical protein [bacterium]
MTNGGCGGQGDRPPLGYVSGKVTVDGEPFKGVIITFMPDEGRSASAETNDKGEYELSYLHGVKGCKIGPNSVVFFAPTGGSPSHAIPKAYQERSDLKADVKKGSNEFNFDLKADAPGKPAPKLKGPVLD